MYSTLEKFDTKLEDLLKDFNKAPFCFKTTVGVLDSTFLSTFVAYSILVSDAFWPFAATPT